MEVYPTVTNISRSMWKILVIDDDEDDLFIVKEMLREAKGRKVDVHWATTFEAGREALQSPDYNAILVDYDLGPRTGIELIREANAQGVAAPLILFTGRGSYEVDIEAMEAGATLYLTKGEANPLLLERGIRYAIDLKQKETELRLSKEHLEQELTERRRAEEQLAFHASLLDNIHDAIIANDVEQRITAWNKAAEKLYGYTAEEALGKIHGDLLHSEISYQQRASLLEQLQEKDEYALEVVQHTKDGRRLIVEGRTIPRRDENGSITGYVTANRDITERKQAEEELRLSEERYRVAAINAPTVYAQTDRELRYQWIHNPHPDFRASDVIGKRDDELVDNEDTRRLVALKQQVLDRGVGLREELVFHCSDGVHTYDMTLEPLRDREGQVVGVTTASFDITARKQSEQARQESETRFHALISASAQVLYQMSPDWSEMRQLQGGNFLADTEEPNRNWMAEYIHPDDQQWVQEVIDKAVLTGSVFELEHRVLRADGTIGWTASRAVPIRNAEGEIVEWFGAASDISERKKIENELRQREDLLEAFFVNSPSILNIVDEEFRYLKTGNLTPPFFGLDRQSIVGRAIKDLAPEFVENFGPVMKQVMHTGQVEQREVQFPVYGVDGVKTNWQASFFPIPLPEGKTGVGIIGVEITALKMAEEALRESNEALQVVLAQAEQGRLLLKALLDNIPEGITITGGPPDFPLEHVSRYGLELTRNPNNPELLGKAAGEHQKDWQIFLADGETLPSKEQMPLYRASHYGETVRNEEMVIRAQNGDWIPVLVNAAPIRDEQGQIKGAINSWRDITERKQAEKALLEREEMLQLALSAGDAGAWSWDLTTNTVQWSQEYDRIFGFEPGTIEPTVEAGFSRIHPEDRFRIEVVTQEAIVKGKKIDEVHRVIWPDESVHWVRGLSQAFYDPQGKPERLAGIALDVTSEKQEEEMLAKYAEQLARSNQELTQFAFIASHDLQEPLRKIKQFGNTLQQKLKGKLDEDTQDSFDRMLYAVDRMQKMIQDLLELSRVNTQGTPFVEVDLSQVATEVVSDLEALIHRTKGQVIIDPLPVIQADHIQMHRVLQNIIGNGLKFHKPDTSPVIKISSEILKEGSTTDQKVLIRVEDNDIGFEEDQFEQIMKPFRRLHGRSEYEGTGMGLAIVKKIIDRHQGEITVKSKPGQGATFIITLPIKQIG